MEALGAVASIVQIAQLGTQISIALYQVAQTIKSANKETRYVAKDIALFCTVLKDLAKALEAGKKAKVFRQHAFDSSLKICDECKSVFVEIEDVLKQVTGVDNPLDCKFTLPRTERMLWAFRKGKVEFLRGVLESLKSTIILELAVLNYAMKVSADESKDKVDVDELLAIKSLVLANETAIEDLRILKDGNKNIAADAYVDTTMHATFANNPLSGGTGSMNVGSLAHVQAFAMPQSPFVSGATLKATDSNITTPFHWDQVDRLELALQKLNLARWEHDRWEEKIDAHNHNMHQPPAPSREAFLMKKLKSDLLKFGMKQGAVQCALEILQADDPMLNQRVSVKHTLPELECKRWVLRASCLVDNTNTAGAGNIVVQRWLPDIFSDFLWHRTREYITAACVRVDDDVHLPLNTPTSSTPLSGSHYQPMQGNWGGVELKGDNSASQISCDLDDTLHKVVEGVNVNVDNFNSRTPTKKRSKVERDQGGAWPSHMLSDIQQTNASQFPTESESQPDPVGLPLPQTSMTEQTDQRPVSPQSRHPTVSPFTAGAPESNSPGFVLHRGVQLQYASSAKRAAEVGEEEGQNDKRESETPTVEVHTQRSGAGEKGYRKMSREIKKIELYKRHIGHRLYEGLEDEPKCTESSNRKKSRLRASGTFSLPSIDYVYQFARPTLSMDAKCDREAMVLPGASFHGDIQDGAAMQPVAAWPGPAFDPLPDPLSLVKVQDLAYHAASGHLLLQPLVPPASSEVATEAASKTDRAFAPGYKGYRERKRLELKLNNPVVQRNRSGSAVASTQSLSVPEGIRGSISSIPSEQEPYTFLSEAPILEHNRIKCADTRRFPVLESKKAKDVAGAASDYNEEEEKKKTRAGYEEREKYFAECRDDDAIQAVRRLLREWTVVDEL